MTDVPKKLLALLLDHDAENPDVLASKIEALYREALHKEFMRGFSEGQEDAMGGE